jgi:molybdopterin-guanine dinucleotide biosynthesis protein A
MPSSAAEPARLAAIVLAGGGGTRLGGVDKATVELDGVTLLERALAATMAARPVVVVGPERSTSRPVVWTREQPPGGGPAAGILAGLDRLEAGPDLVVVLAVDMPRVDAGTVARLARAAKSAPDLDGAVLVDPGGHRQPLAGVYRRTALDAARPADRSGERGISVRALVRDLRLAEEPVGGDEARDVDTWDDLRELS